MNAFFAMLLALYMSYIYSYMKYSFKRIPILRVLTTFSTKHNTETEIININTLVKLETIDKKDELYDITDIHKNMLQKQLCDDLESPYIHDNTKLEFIKNNQYLINVSDTGSSIMGINLTAGGLFKDYLYNFDEEG